MDKLQQPGANGPKPRRTALITGASAGIGEAFARELAADGVDLVLVARREDRLRTLAAELSAVHDVTAAVVVADLADPQAPQRIVDQLQAQNRTVDILVNNAGFGLPGKYVNTTWADQQAFIQVLVTAVAHLTHLLLPQMVERGYGRIINVSSVAALMPGSTGHTLYGAAKAFLVRFSESLANELVGTGVHATALCPGLTFSEFHDVSGTRGLVSRLPRFLWLDATAVARQGIDAVMSDRAGHPICITGAANRALARFFKYLPDRIALTVVRGTSSRIRDAS
jgi:uncharacterized protein